MTIPRLYNDTVMFISRDNPSGHTTRLNFRLIRQLTLYQPDCPVMPGCIGHRERIQTPYMVVNGLCRLGPVEPRVCPGQFGCRRRSAGLRLRTCLSCSNQLYRFRQHVCADNRQAIMQRSCRFIWTYRYFFLSKYIAGIHMTINEKSRHTGL